MRAPLNKVFITAAVTGAVRALVNICLQLGIIELRIMAQKPSFDTV